MMRFVGTRLLWSVATLWMVVTLSFALMRAAPGGPFSSDKPLPLAVEANLKRTFGLAADVVAPSAGRVVLIAAEAGRGWSSGETIAIVRTGEGDVKVVSQGSWTSVRAVVSVGAAVAAGDVLAIRETTLLEQYAVSLSSYLRADFGVTYTSEGTRTVLENIAEGFAVSLELGLYALALALAVGVGSGLIAAMNRNTWIDHAAMGGALLAVSMSSIVVGPLLVLVFCVELGWLPWGGWDAWSWADGAWRVKILPSTTLGLVYAAWFSRLVRAGLLDVMEQPWVRTARAKGLTETRIVLVHALKPALLPAVSYLGPALAGIVTGSVVVERIFAVPGIGEHFVAAALSRDYPMVMGTVVLYAALLIAANFAVDMLYGVLDPRVRARALDV